MIRYISLRLLFAVPALWLIVTMVFMLAHIVPGDPVQQMLGEGARAEDLQQLRHSLGLDVPVFAQYRHYLAGVLRGDLGESFRFREPVTRVVLSHYPATLELAIVALLVCLAIGIPAGLLAAELRATATDRAVGFFTLLGLSVPSFALGPVLILVFSVILGWMPVSGRGGPSHLVLPAITLGAALAAILTRMVRISVIEELSSDYVRTARAKGLSPSAVLFRHAFRNALIPILTILGLQNLRARETRVAGPSGHDQRDNYFADARAKKRGKGDGEKNAGKRKERVDEHDVHQVVEPPAAIARERADRQTHQSRPDHHADPDQQ